MKRKTMIPVLVFALSVTVLVVVANIRGSFFQSSLLSEGEGVTVGSGAQFRAPSLATGSGAGVEEFPIQEERTKVYRDALLGSDGTNDVGFYFPHIYKFDKAGKGLVSIAFRPNTEYLIEKNLRLTVSYPSKVMKYVGATTASSTGATMTVDAVSQPNQMIIELTPAPGVAWWYREEMPTFLQLPMEVTDTNALLPNTGLQLRIVNVEHVGFDNATAPWPFAKAPVDILYYTPASGEAARRVPTGEVRIPGARGVLTQEVKTTSTSIVTPSSSSPSGSVQAFRLPLVTQDQTRIAPPLIREKSRETVFVYLSVTDPDGMEDIKAVEMDLSTFGLASRVPLVQVNTGPKYSVFGGSFILPDSVSTRTTPYDIPYMITDGGSNVVKGSLKFVVRPAATEGATTVTGLNPSTNGLTGVSLLDDGDTSTGRPEGIDVETDLNGDGKVDNTDLAIYLFTFNLDRD